MTCPALPSLYFARLGLISSNSSAQSTKRRGQSSIDSPVPQSTGRRMEPHKGIIGPQHLHMNSPWAQGQRAQIKSPWGNAHGPTDSWPMSSWALGTPAPMTLSPQRLGTDRDGPGQARIRLVPHLFQYQNLNFYHFEFF